MKLFLYRIYQCIFMLPVLLVLTVVTALLTIVGSLCGGGRWWGYYPPKLWARIFCWLSFVKVTITGKENIDKRTSYLFVANHQGAYDIFAIYGFLPHQFRWMMKKSLERIPLVGYSCKACGQIFVDNSSPAAIRRTMQDAEKRLAGGMSLVVFPEGARTWDGHMRPFKRGAYKLASEFRFPMVPVSIDGAFDVMPRFKKIPHWGQIKLTIHQPIEAPTDESQLAEAITKTRDAIASSLPPRFQPKS